ncbi:hypothetical protein J2T17_007561 [Paenibacillus mucilaginosus]|uniref:hypothetical protein n=1 Tax=Paenibacillus mucilaginosus TaxID=61624 RepID=UPI003D242BB7
MRQSLSWFLAVIITTVSVIYVPPATAAVTLDEYGQLHSDGGPDNDVDFSITLTKETQLHSSPEPDSETAYSLSPQTVQATFMQGASYKIKTTWIGDMWIKPEWPYIFNMKEEKKPVVLASKTPVYQYPYYNVLGELDPQTLESIATAAGGWYCIETSYGKQTWVHPSISAPLHVETLNETIEVDGFLKDTYMYPHTRSVHFGHLEQTILKPTEKTAIGDWYHVESPDGMVWVELPKERIAQDYVTELELYSNRDLYDAGGAGKWLGVIGPQKVKVSKRIGIWVKIDTWLGPAWIVDPREELRQSYGL